MARVSTVSPEFSLTVENGAWVAEICRVLDGMPLAIELAVARVRALSVKQIAERLDDRFKLLTGGSRTAPLRQQTLAAAWIGAMHCLLNRSEGFYSGSRFLQAEQLSKLPKPYVFANVFSLEKFYVISHLVDKSLVVAEQSSVENVPSLVGDHSAVCPAEVSRTGG